ncbi:MAG: acetylglutamate kinase [Acidobacteriota bacterium]|nr:acetylglutamate kinase [Acidobacteriota bacterium]
MTDSENHADFGAQLDRALRYVAEWRRKRVVVKFGGRALEKNEIGTLVEDLVLLQQSGLRPVLVHGGGPEISRTLERLGIQPQFIDGLRVTDQETVDVVEMVLAGRVNKRLVSMIQDHGGRAVGLSGKDGKLLEASPHPRAAELGFVGEVKQVSSEIIELLVRENYIPVVCSIGFGPAGETYNLNADTVAAGLAVALGAEKLIVLTDVQGIHGPTCNGEQRITTLNPDEAADLMKTGVVSSGMVPKLEACVSAVVDGVPSSHIIAAGEPHGVLVELFTESGVGTMIRKEKGAPQS